MKQLTLRGFDDELEREILRVADTYGISLNQAVLRLLRRAAGLEAPQSPEGGVPGPPRVGSALDRHFGTWTQEEAEELAEANRVFEQIDEDLWS